MLGNDNCNIKNEKIRWRHRRTPSQFLRYVLYEEDKCKIVRANEILMTSENPMIKEQKLQTEICSEAKKLKHENFLEERRNRLLHQNVDGIRELDVQIKRANVQRQLVEQKAFKEHILQTQLQARLDQNKLFKEENKRNEAIAFEKEKESFRKKAALRQDLLKQMQEKEKQREMEKETKNRERESREKLIESIQEDIKNEKQYQIEMKMKLKKETDEYLKIVEVFKSKRRDDDEAVLRRQEEEIRIRDEEKKLRTAKRIQAREERAAHSERMGQKVYNLEMEKRKHDDFLLELLIEERLAKDNKRYKKNLEKQAQRSRSLQEDLQRFFFRREQELLSKRDEEKIAIREQFKGFQEVEKRDNNIKDLKVSKDEQYRQDLLNTVEAKRWERKLEAAQNKKEYEQQLALKKKHQQEIEAEKLRLLRSLPLENLKFLPANAISEEHRSLLGLTCKKRNEIFD